MKKGSFKIKTTEVDNLWIIHTPTQYNNTNKSDTRNSIKGSNQTCENIVDIGFRPESRESRKILRAESVKNSRRYYNKGNLNQARHPTTILSSYMPLKNYMVKEQNWSKPIRQSNKDHNNIIKSTFPQRNGNRTMK